MLKKYPELVRAMKERPQKYNEQTQYVFDQEKLGNTFVICPETSLGISRTCSDAKELRRVYEEGRRTALKVLDSVKNFLSE